MRYEVAYNPELNAFEAVEGEYSISSHTLASKEEK